MFGEVEEAGKVTCLHSCGNIWPILGDLVDIGLNVYQTVLSELYDLAAFKKEYGSTLCFYGGISTQRELPACSPEEIKRFVHETIALLDKGGGYIVAPTHRIPADVPPENLAARVDAFKTNDSRKGHYDESAGVVRQRVSNVAAQHRGVKPASVWCERNRICGNV